MSKPVAEVTNTDVVQVIMSGIVFREFVHMLTVRGLVIEPWTTTAEDVATFMVSVAGPQWTLSPRCGAWGTPGCILPAGHNQGKADVPENHQFSIIPKGVS